jgi:hypothetical protein
LKETMGVPQAMLSWRTKGRLSARVGKMNRSAALNIRALRRSLVT